MITVLLASTSKIKSTVVQKLFMVKPDTIEVSGYNEQPFGLCPDGIRETITNVLYRFGQIPDKEVQKYDYIIVIENGIVQIPNISHNVYVDVSDVLIYDVKNKNYHTTTNMPFDEMIKVPVPIGEANTIEEKYSLKHGTIGKQIASQYKLFEKNSENYDDKNWMKHFGIDRHYQIEVSLNYVMSTLRTNLTSAIQRKVIITPNFPEKGVIFQDYQNVFGDHQIKKQLARYFTRNLILDKDNLLIAGPELRGYMGTEIATILGTNHVMIRKSKDGSVKMAGNLMKESLKVKEYNNGSEFFYCLKETFEGKKVIVFDDILATGGSINACCDLIEKCGGKVIKLLFLADVSELSDKAKEVLKDRYNIIDIAINSADL
jgi:adenine phosphoribosyltransferase